MINLNTTEQTSQIPENLSKLYSSSNVTGLKCYVAPVLQKKLKISGVERDGVKKGGRKHWNSQALFCLKFQVLFYPCN